MCRSDPRRMEMLCESWATGVVAARFPDSCLKSHPFLTAAETPDTVPAAVRGCITRCTGTFLRTASARCRTTSADPGTAPEFDSNCATSRRRQGTPACARMRERWSSTHGECDEKDRNTAIGLHGIWRHGSALGAIVVARLGQLPSTVKAADRHPGRHRGCSAIVAPGASGRWRSAGRCGWKRLRPTWCVRRIHYSDRADVGRGNACRACRRTGATARARATPQEWPVPWCAERQSQGV